jgi:hypothetical protein
MRERSVGLAAWTLTLACGTHDSEPISVSQAEDDAGGARVRDAGDAPTSDSPGSDAPETPRATSAEPGSGPSAVATEQAPTVILDNNSTGSPCERHVELSQLVLDEAPPFDVVIVADNSGSIDWSRDDLATGLRSLLDGARGRDVRFFVLTSTQYGADSAAFEATTHYHGFDYADPATGEPYGPAVTQYSQSCTSPDGTAIECPTGPVLEQPDYSLSGNFEFVLPAPAAAISHEMDDEVVTAQQDLVADAILNLGTNGSPYEQPICTLARYVGQEPEQLGDHVVFVVLSDEDDSSADEDCLVGYDAERYTVNSDPSAPCEDCQIANYHAASPIAVHKLHISCTPHDDMGEPEPALATEHLLEVAQTAECDYTEHDCDAQDLATASQSCGQTDTVECTRTCQMDNVACILQLPEDQLDACASPIEVNGQQYDSFIDYCSQSYPSWPNFDHCSYDIRPVTVPTGGTPNLKLVPRQLLGDRALTTTLSEEFKAQADSKIGAGNYFVEVIGLEPEFSCELQAGQSYATNLGALASSPDDVFPICESYAPALQRIEKFAERLLRTTYTIELAPRETLKSVSVVDRGGNTRNLNDDEFTFDDETFLLTIAPGAIHSADVSLSVELDVHCSEVR